MLKKMRRRNLEHNKVSPFQTKKKFMIFGDS